MIIDMPTVSMGNTSGSILPAEKVSYDNTVSGLTAENVQDALDEMNSNFYKIHDISSNINFTSVINPSWGDCVVKRLGNLVSVSITRQLTTNITNDIEIYATGFPKPVTDVIVNDSFANSGAFNRLCLESATGNLRNNWSVSSSVVGGNSIQGTFCYITSDPM